MLDILESRRDEINATVEKLMKDLEGAATQRAAADQEFVAGWQALVDGHAKRIEEHTVLVHGALAEFRTIWGALSVRVMAEVDERMHAVSNAIAGGFAPQSDSSAPAQQQQTSGDSGNG